MIGQHRSTQRKAPKDNADEQRLTAGVIELARQYGRYGYRRIHGLVQLLDGEIFYTLEEVRVISGWWREHYNKIRPHSALGNRPPAPQAILPRWPIGTAALRRSPILAAEPAMN